MFSTLIDGQGDWSEALLLVASALFVIAFATPFVSFLRDAWIRPLALLALALTAFALAIV